MNNVEDKMDKEILRHVQLTQLEILKEIKRVCIENDITYWLTYGTLLGAVRHKGFIPWDDDLDIGMLRSDYEKFLKIATEKLNPSFILQTWELDKYYQLPFAKVRKSGTVYTEYQFRNSKALNGIYVDIFPYDNYGDNLMQGFQLKLIKLMMLSKCGIKSWKELGHFNIKKYITHIPSRLLSHFFTRKKLIAVYKKNATKYNGKVCDCYFSQGFDKYTTTSVIPHYILEHFQEIIFEDDSFTVPVEYDKFLKINYGDYMKLPSEEKRENRHEIIEVKFYDKGV